MDASLDSLGKNELSLEESEKERLRLEALLSQTQYANEQFHQREWELRESWTQLSQQQAALEAARWDLSQGITHRVDLENDKSPSRKGNSEPRDKSHKPSVTRDPSKKSHKSKRKDSRTRVRSPPRLRERSRTPRRSTTQFRKARRNSRGRSTKNRSTKKRSKSNRRHRSSPKRKNHSRRNRSRSASATLEQKCKRMTEKMMDDLDGRSRFTYFRRRDFENTAKILSKAGFDDWERVRKATEETRKNLREDLRWAGHSAKELSLVNEIFNHYELDKPRSHSTSDKKDENVKFEEPVVPNLLRRWNVNLSKISSFLAPDREMANHFSKEFATASKKDPPYIPLTRTTPPHYLSFPPQNIARNLVGTGVCWALFPHD